MIRAERKVKRIIKLLGKDGAKKCLTVQLKSVPDQQRKYIQDKLDIINAS